MSSNTPLYGHVSPETAYVVADYPYGFNARTEIRYWLESKPGKGWRFVSQTKNPKTGAWNKPKASTYIDWAAALYLDEKNHVQWAGIGRYTEGAKALEFVREFPLAERAELHRIAEAKVSYYSRLLTGCRRFLPGRVNGVRAETSEIEGWTTELAAWGQVAANNMKADYPFGFVPSGGKHDVTCVFLCSDTRCVKDHRCSVCDRKIVQEIKFYMAITGERDSQWRAPYTLFWAEPDGVFRPEISLHDGLPVGYRRGQCFRGIPELQLQRGDTELAADEDTAKRQAWLSK